MGVVCGLFNLQLVLFSLWIFILVRVHTAWHYKHVRIAYFSHMQTADISSEALTDRVSMASQMQRSSNILQTHLIFFRGATRTNPMWAAEGWMPAPNCNFKVYSHHSKKKMRGIWRRLEEQRATAAFVWPQEHGKKRYLLWEYSKCRHFWWVNCIIDQDGNKRIFRENKKVQDSNDHWPPLYNPSQSFMQNAR